MPHDTHQEEAIRRFTKLATERLVGKRIKSVFYATPQETGLQSHGLVLILEDGTALICQSDSEGNDAGALRLVPPFEFSGEPITFPRIY